MLADDSASSFISRLSKRLLRFPGNVALRVAGTGITYGELWERASTIRDGLVAQGVMPGDRVAVLGSREAGDYMAILGILLAGGAYVPLNPKFPAERNTFILECTGAVGLLVDEENQAFVQRASVGAVRFILDSFTSAAYSFTPAGVSDIPGPFENGAYIIFTSGTSGMPNGVPITRANLEVYMENLEALFPIGPADRVAHLSDLSFDFSVHEIFYTWWHCATLVVIPQRAALMATRYVQDEEITVWISVPSAVSLAHKAGVFEPGSMPSVRLAFFCGEALTLMTARHFAAAAPAARIINLWGPTEATVSFTYFEVQATRDLPDILPIGKEYANQFLALVDGNDAILPLGQIGELIQSGSQVTAGYWQNPDLNAVKFLEKGGQRWYRSGDLAIWDERYGYCYMGRTDRQVKVKGYRIELQDCESAIRHLAQRDLVCVVPWQKTPDGAIRGLAGFICGTSDDPLAEAAALRENLKSALPIYMIPERLVFVPQFPFNSNGKVDYKALERDADKLLGEIHRAF